MEAPKGFLSLKGLRLGITNTEENPQPEIFLCPEDLSYFTGNLAVSGILTAGSISIPSTTVADLHIPIGTPNASHPSLSRPISLFDTGFTTDIGLNFNTQTHGTEAFQLLDKYISVYLYDVPPAPTLGTTSNNSTSVTLNWTNTPTIPSAFLPINLPFINDVRIDFIESSLNVGKTWVGASTTISTGTSLTNQAIFYASGSGSGLSGNTYNYHNILPNTLYDFRVYQVNYGGTPYTGKPWKYLNFYEFQTASVGAPGPVIGITASSITSTTSLISWTKPVIHDIVSSSTTSPIISSYTIQNIPLGTSRWPSIYDNSIITRNTQTTSTPTNSNPFLTVTGLLPGTSFDVSVAAKNEIAVAYGTTNNSVSLVTLPPTAPTYLGTSDCNSLFQADTFVFAGCSFNGNTITAPIVKYNTQIRTVVSPAIRLNEFPGAIGSSIASLTAKSLIGTTQTSITLSVSGMLDTPNISGTTANGPVSLAYLGVTDAYTGSNSGFWETEQFYVLGVSPGNYYLGSSSVYQLKLEYVNSGVSVVTNPVSFYIDDVNTVPSVLGPRVLLGNTGWQYISGIPSYNVSGSFHVLFEMFPIANYFLRSDKVHATLRILNNADNTGYSSSSTISQSSIGTSFNYYIGTSDVSVGSTILISGIGGNLISNPGNVQFKDSIIALDLGSNVYSEDFVIGVTAYNLYGNSGLFKGGYTGKFLRIDTKSISNTQALTHQVTSGTTQYPNLSATEAGYFYDHSETIIGTKELQLVNGKYQTPSSSSDGYLDYTNSYFNGAILRDYTSIISDSDYRYVTFKFTGLEIGIISPNTREKIRIIINDNSGLTVNMTTPNLENHRCQVRVVDLGDGSGVSDTSTVGWMDACNVVSPIGILTGTNGTGCLNQSTSTNSQRDVILRNGTTQDAIIYVRIGIQNNVSASFGSVSVSSVVAF